jgi:predicted nucleotidyltransferase
MAAPEQKDKPKGIEFYGGYEVYSESGVDLTLLGENLRRSVEERWQDACRGAIIFEAFHPTAPRHSPRKERKGMFDPTTIVRRLLEQGVKFVVVDGLAMVARGSSYLTKDLDICYKRSPENLAALVAALAPLHPYLRGAPPGLPFQIDVPTLHAGLNFTFITDCGDLDLLGEVSGVGNYSQVLGQSSEESMFGMRVHVLSIDGLIAAKKAAGRNKDQSHLLELIELKKKVDADKSMVDDRGPATSAEGP